MKEKIIKSISHSVNDDSIAELCLKCEYRDYIDDLTGIPFCDHSSTSCARWDYKVECSDFLRKKPIQLSLF